MKGPEGTSNVLVPGSRPVALDSPEYPSEDPFQRERDYLSLSGHPPRESGETGVRTKNRNLKLRALTPRTTTSLQVLLVFL